MNPFLKIVLILFPIIVSCSHRPIEPEIFENLTSLKLMDSPALAQTGKNPIHLGGFSGLIFDGQNSETNAYKFISVTDRGPNTDPLKIKDQEKRPFLIPEYTPEIVHLEANPRTRELKITRRIPLTNPKGKLISGLPNSKGDEDPVDIHGRYIVRSLEGLDIEGITRDSEGNFWICEEYRPSILKVSPEGRILKRYIPKKSLSAQDLKFAKSLWGSKNVLDILPEEFGKRRPNRGFEGITFQDGLLYAALQSPLDKGGAYILWLEFNPKTEKSKILLYPLTDLKVDKIGDITSFGSQVLVFEQNSKTGSDTVKMIYSISGIEKASHNIQEKPLNKKLLLNLGKLPGYGKNFDHEKIEGLAVISSEVLAVIHDNDFGLTGNLTISDGVAEKKSDPSSNLLLIHLDPKL